MTNGIALGSLNRARYAGLDFDTHNDDLRAQLQVKYAADFNDFSISSLGIMLLDLTAYGLDALSFYLDRRATDTYLTTARTRASVARASRQLGYKMGGAVASSVDLQVTVEDVYSFDVPVPAGFQFEGPNSLIFESAEEVTFAPAEQGLTNSKIIPAYEGETIQESFISDGTSSQVFELRRIPDNKFVVQGTVTANVDGAPWSVVNLLEYGATDQFEVGFNDEPSTVRFGDGIAGNIPTAGASIDVTYVASRGKEGQVGRETITEEVTPLVVSFNEISLSITNPEGSVGGDDRETLASAQAFAPKKWKTREVAVVNEDYKTLAGAYADPLFGRVAVAKAISSRSAATDLTVQNLLDTIWVAVQTLNTTLTTSTTNMNTSLTNMDASFTQIATDTADITTQVADINTETGTARTSLRSIKDYSGEISVDATDIGNHVTSGQAEVDASSASTGEKNAIKEWFNLIDTERTNIGTAAGNAVAAADSAISDLNSIEDLTADLVTSLTSANTEVANLSTERTNIGTEVSNIDTVNTALVEITDPSDTDSVIYAINVHFDKILAADCKANLINVPILVRDSGGFYTAPSSGLMQSLQDYLDERKEVTQTVSVTSGELFLVSAVVRARVGVSSGYSESVISTAVEATISGVLRDREFGVSLYESDLDDVILAIEGVSFVNARIEGHLATDGTTVLVSRLDSDGNLVILDSEVISRGTITVTTEAAI